MTSAQPAPQRGLDHFFVPALENDPRRGYRTVLDRAVLAEQLGYETVWVAEGHVSTAGLPAALTFLAALSQRTTSLRLGTAVITLAFENRLALAETAAVVDALSDGRLELGVGKSNGGGWSTSAFAAFHLPEEDRDALFAEALAELRSALAGTHAGDPSPLLYPPGDALLTRLWSATSNPETARRTGAAGDGLQLHRTTRDGVPGDVQSRLVDHYLAAYAGASAPRIAISRVVLPADDEAAAVDLLRRYMESHPWHYRRLDRGQDLGEHLRTSNIAFGSTEQIVDFLGRDAAVGRSTRVLYSIPLPFDAPEYATGLATIAEAVHPHVRLADHQRAANPA